MDVTADNCVAALHQKRLLAFLNHFLVRNIQFLNNFSCQCEAKLISFEIKMNKLEASLKILESQLNSIPDNEDSLLSTLTEEKQMTHSQETEKTDKGNSNISTENVTLPARDARYKKFFKMIQVGVPMQAVKLKVIQEGLDPGVLEEG